MMRGSAKENNHNNKTPDIMEWRKRKRIWSIGGLASLSHGAMFDAGEKRGELQTEKHFERDKGWF